MSRISTEVLNEIVENNGSRMGSALPINATGVVRLALDLRDARAERDRLRAALEEIRELALSSELVAMRPGIVAAVRAALAESEGA